ncbi:MAG: SPW repeat protein [Acidobacteriota bacterium]|nr:SPW repeat protein [Acidobacteriota bacterium]
MKGKHKHHGETPPNQEKQGAEEDDKAAMPEMSPEEHSKIMHGKSGNEDSETMSHGSMSGMGGMAMSGGFGLMSHGMGAMSSADHTETMWRESLWASFVNLLLGAWLVTSPFTFGYRSAAMTWSDILSGSLIIVFSLFSASRKFNAYARWAVCFVGIWLLFAPLVFWSPDAAAYANDTLTGALVIAFAVLVTMMPGMDMSMMTEGSDVPPGWSYNPSTWLQRAPIILLAVIGFLASRYMAAFQLGHINTVWDPFFGDSTRRVLTSDVSKMFPISDAGLGALAYVIEILMGFMGDRARWRTMPWMVTFFGILVVPLGTVSVILIILQPLSVGAWCSLCLLASIAMLIMIPATLDEVVAMIQFMMQARREGKPLWRTFWLGGVVEGEKDDRLTPFDWSRPFQMFSDWIVSNWNLQISIGLGLWLMFAPAVLGTTGRAADSDRLLGVFIVTFTAIAVAEVARPVRFLNMLFGAWLVAAPFLLAGFTPAAFVNGIVVGFVLIVLSFSPGKIRGRYGSWDYYIR